MGEALRCVAFVLLLQLRCVLSYEPPYAEMMEWARNDYYGALGVKPDIGQRELAKHYRKLSLQLHPDKNPGKEAEVEARFTEVAAAYGVLKKPEHRAAYDKFFMSIPSAFRPKFDDKPIMEFRNLMLFLVLLISVLQWFYWNHHRQLIVERMLKDATYKRKLAKAHREGKTLAISGAEPAVVTDTIFFTIPLIPFYFPAWAWHRMRWLVENVLMRREITVGEEKYWMQHSYGWDDREFQEWFDKREATYAEAGGKEAFLEQQQLKYQQYMRKYERAMAKRG